MRKGGTEPARKYVFLYGKGNANYEVGRAPLCIRESDQQLSVFCLLVVGFILKVHAPTYDINC
jgi:hypothetical protein